MVLFEFNRVPIKFYRALCIKLGSFNEFNRRLLEMLGFWWICPGTTGDSLKDCLDFAGHLRGSDTNFLAVCEARVVCTYVHVYICNIYVIQAYVHGRSGWWYIYIYTSIYVYVYVYVYIYIYICIYIGGNSIGGSWNSEGFDGFARGPPEIH